jgi:hypothetical protein
MALPNGPAAEALRPPGVLGLSTPSVPELTGETAFVPTGGLPPALRAVGALGAIGGLLALAPEQEEAQEVTIPDRHRRMEFNGYTVKVRCNPRWLIQGRALAAARQPNPQNVAAFFKMVKRRRASAQVSIAETLAPFLRAKGKDGLADQLESLVATNVPLWRELE